MSNLGRISFFILLNLINMCFFQENSSNTNNKPKILEHKSEYEKYLKKEYKRLSKEEVTNNDNWDEVMSDYHDDFLYRLKLKDKKIIYFQEYLDFNSIFSGVFISDNNEKLLMKVFLNNEEVYSSCSIFHSFKFPVNINNERNMNVLKILFYSDLDLTFTFTMGSDKSKIVTKETLTKTMEKINKIHSFTKKYYFNQKSSKFSRNELNKSKNLNIIIELKQSYQNFYTFSIIETSILLCISLFQYIYLRRLFEIKISL